MTPIKMPAAAPRKRLSRLVVILGVLICVLIARNVLVRGRARLPLPLPDAPLTAVELTAVDSNAGPLFRSLSPRDTGIDFVGRIVADHPLSYLYETGFTSGGVAIGDVDNDGLPDVYFTSGPDRNRLYRQVGVFRFEDVTESAGVGGGGGWSAGAAMADVDNDGRLDIYVCNYDSPNLLYINQGNGTFKEMAFEYGLDIVDACIMSAFCDYDLDGDLDVYVMGNRYVSPHGRPIGSPLEYEDGRVRIRPEYKRYYQITPDRIGYSRAARPDALFQNNGDGTFTVVSGNAGLWGAFQGLSATWFDYNEDGLPDLYVGNDFDGPDQLYRNDGDGTLTDVIKETMPHTTWFSMGADAADLNNDGHIDFVIADMARSQHLQRITSMGPMFEDRYQGLLNPPQYKRNAVFVSSGTGRFLETARMSGMDRTDWTWAVKLADFDNDSRVDAYFSNGFSRDFTDADYPVTPQMLVGKNTWELTESQPELREQDLTYRNLGEMQFEDVSVAWGLDHVGISMSSAYGDFDRDGDLDLVVYNAEGPPLVYQNNESTGDRVMVRLEGARSNRFGIGATVRVRTGEGDQIRLLSPMTGYLSSNEPLAHFGLGKADAIEQLTVDWPSGHRQEFRDLAANRLYIVAEPVEAPPQRSAVRDKSTLFEPSLALSGAHHREAAFDDFAVQPLIPHKLSQLGPSQAWADVDNDGDDDLFLGGAAGQPGAVWKNEGHGRFSQMTQRSLQADANCEDLGAVWFDVDSDADLDLYVVSGGVEFGNKKTLLRDRLYLNDGQGLLTAAAGDALPDLKESGGPVAAADFDRDGDVDLFVGGRVVPDQYPMPANSRLLLNEGGRLIDVTAASAPELLESGMATSAIWTDVDDDEWVDLMVTYQWGPVRLFHNVEGRFVDQTEEAGLADRRGWWNGITGRDLDGDGDVDYIATNLGLNTQYRPVQDAPALLYYGDLDGSGVNRIVEATYEAGKLVPVRSKIRLTEAMPNLDARFETFAAFGSASLEDLFTSERLDAAKVFELNTTDSVVLINDGEGVFDMQPLPPMAQLSPGFGVALTDVDADGRVDVYIAQNYFGPHDEAGRMDGGLSVLLRGDGLGGFTVVAPDESGLIVHGDAKSLAHIDINEDGQQDFVVGVNDSAVMAFERADPNQGRRLRVRLRGKAGNPSGVGARVSVRLDNDSIQTAEIYAGDGYLSQSTSDIEFGHSDERQVESVQVRWPTGETSTATPDRQQRTIVIEQP